MFVFVRVPKQMDSVFVVACGELHAMARDAGRVGARVQACVRPLRAGVRDETQTEKEEPRRGSGRKRAKRGPRLAGAQNLELTVGAPCAR